MPAYATREQFEAYVEGWSTTNPAALDRLLERASRDVDALLGARVPYATGAFAGFKIDPGLLLEWERDALARATCAQAEYRFTVGEEDMASGQGAGRVSGPDFSVEVPAAGAGGRRRFGPKVATELDSITHLRILTARVR